MPWLDKIHLYWNKFMEHEHRPDVAGEHPMGDVFQELLLVLFIAAILIDRATYKTNTVLSPFIPLWTRIIVAILIFGFALKLAIGGLRTVFGEIRKKPVVINEGVFSRSRHPIYLGAILMYLAAELLSLSLIGAAILVINVLYYQFLARYEEKLLLQKFGNEYKQYMQQVPMWLPCPKA